MQHTAPETE